MALSYNESPLRYNKHNFEDDAVLYAQDLRDIDEGVFNTIERVNSQGEFFSQAATDLTNLRTYAVQRLTEHAQKLLNYTDELTSLEDSIDLFIDGTEASEKNCNRLLTPGSYAMNGSYIGSPFTGESSTGYIFVFGHVNTEHPLNTVLCQMCIEGSGTGLVGNIYTRNYSNYEFSAWRKALVESDVTNEIAALQTQYSALLSRVEALENAVNQSGGS